jgi:hypothetical protein
LDAFVRRCFEPDPSAALHMSWSVRCTICTQIEAHRRRRPRA